MPRARTATERRLAKSSIHEVTGKWPELALTEMAPESTTIDGQPGGGGGHYAETPHARPTRAGAGRARRWPTARPAGHVDDGADHEHHRAASLLIARASTTPP